MELQLLYTLENQHVEPQEWTVGSDDFQDFNWVIFRFHENFQGLQGPKKVRHGAYCMAQMSWKMNSQKKDTVWWFLYKTYCSNQPTLRVFQKKMYPKDVFFRILATSLQNGEIYYIETRTQLTWAVIKTSTLQSVILVGWLGSLSWLL